MSQLISSKIVDLLALIVDSIPSNFMDDLSSENREELHTFLETMGIPLDYPNVVRKLTALLILNRLKFIIQNEKKNSYMNLSIERLFSILEQKFTRVFTSSIVSKMATKSSLVIFPELFSYKSEVLMHTGNLFVVLYEGDLKKSLQLAMLNSNQVVTKMGAKHGLLKRPPTKKILEKIKIKKI